MTNSFKARSTLQVGDRSYEIWSLAALPREKVARLPYSLEDPAGEPAALRGRRERHARGHRGAAGLGPRGDALVRDRLHAGARHPAGLHRRALRRGPGGDARCHRATRRRRRARQSAGARPSWSSTTPCRSMSTAPPGALAANTAIEFARNGERYAFLRWGQTAFRNFQVVPPEHRHRAPGQPRVPRPRDLRRRSQRQAPAPIRTPWSAPTRTPP